MAQGYRQAAILIAACQLNVFTHLSQGPLPAEALAQSCGVPVRGLQRLLNACVVLDLLEKDDERYYNTPIAETFLVQNKPAYMGNFIIGGMEHYEAWGQLTQAIREDRPTNPHSAEALATLPPERVRGYVQGLYDLGKRNAVAIADRLDLTGVQQMLDVAGGSGIYSITFAQRQPGLRAVVFDLPPIVPFTQDIIARHGMQERVTPVPGNYFHDEFAGGNDLVLVSYVLQTEGVQNCRVLLGKVFKALAPGGQLVIHGIMPNPDRVTPPQPALFQLQMLLSFPEGDAHPAEEICTWAAEAGFVDLTATRLPAPAFTSLVTGRKPA
ncbi:MAG TPA: methyltransferase dimerization domain-containing protein [Candidatus Tectomicrobia bacterium]|nr:methyltransferase dimerization domain-containing protein [Candidatus Tectomicrobia bacterium]